MPDRLTGRLPVLPKDRASWERVESRRGQAALSQPTEVEGGMSDQLNVVRFPPSIYPPPGAIYIYGEASANVVGPGTTVSLAGLQVQVPRNAVGVIREITLNINNMLATTNVRWQLQFNQMTVQGYDLTMFPRAAASVADNYGPDSTVVPFPDGALISMPITVIDAGAYLVGASYRGWFFSKAVAKKYGFVGWQG